MFAGGCDAAGSSGCGATTRGNPRRLLEADSVPVQRRKSVAVSRSRQLRLETQTDHRLPGTTATASEYFTSHVCKSHIEQEPSCR